MMGAFEGRCDKLYGPSSLVRPAPGSTASYGARAATHQQGHHVMHGGHGGAQGHGHAAGAAPRRAVAEGEMEEDVATAGGSAVGPPRGKR
jgi:hypothetical protein